MDVKAILDRTRFLFQQLTFKVIPVDRATVTLRGIERDIRSIPVSDWPAIRLNYVAELSKLKWDIEYLLREPNIRANNGFLIGFRDRVRARLFEGIDIINERKIVTNAFNEFIKGITYFQRDHVNTDEPVYHRDGACPPRDMPNLKCAASISDAVKKRIYTCYIERLIYDELWLQIMGTQQDGSHIRWLQDTKDAFRTCFPNTTIRISLRLSNGKPDNVAIIDETDSDTTTELYEKAYFPFEARYDTQITAIKLQDSTVIAVKTNTYDREGAWQPITTPGGRGSGKKSVGASDPVKSVLDAIIQSRRGSP